MEHGEDGGFVPMPSGYREALYIQNTTGAEKINTGIYGSQNTIIQADCVYNALISSDLFWIGTSSNEENTRILFTACTRNPYWGYYFFGSFQGFISIYKTLNERHKIILQNGSITCKSVDDTILSYGSFQPVGNFQTYYGIELFAVISDIPASSISLFSFIIKNGEQIVFYGTPCVNDQNEAGLWDGVLGAFYGNVGEGSFIAGFN